MACSRSLVAALLLVATAVGAQPVTRPDHACRVVVTLAPDDVRAEIEAWVGAEPRCVRELEVRVVPTEDGLYLSATDARGRVRERIVPDAQSAAVLVVSWMADDTLGPRLPVRSLIEPPAAAPTSAGDDEIPREVMAPGLMRTIQRQASGRGRRWLTFGAVGSSRERAGMRASIDLFAGRTWSLGLAGGGLRAEHDDRGTAQARVLIGATRTFGRISLRAQLGFGVDATPPADRMDRDAMTTARDERPHVVPAVEAGVLAKVRISRAWGVVGGPIISSTSDDRATVSVFLGAQYGL